MGRSGAEMAPHPGLRRWVCDRRQGGGHPREQWMKSMPRRSSGSTARHSAAASRNAESRARALNHRGSRCHSRVTEPDKPANVWSFIRDRLGSPVQTANLYAPEFAYRRINQERGALCSAASIIDEKVSQLAQIPRESRSTRRPALPTSAACRHILRQAFGYSADVQGLPGSVRRVRYSQA
jgi:hypothetical protein